ncbi:MAG TPA: bifunctional glutamate N-acetyltransferase/amino-acid acetyltransferase ArgJ [Candidatus Binatia bacterium]|nr:bifunctional glutamate N-acetyltransferase/amino-acid acetyltransferase ArgJ [Candidatus Binatia bacterium]
MANIEVRGFKFAGVACGIKKSKKKDLALIFSERPALAAALFTTNRVKSPAVLVGMKRVRRGRIQAVVINSGNANACTGSRGLRDAEAVCRKAASLLRISPFLVMPSSTGIIGVPLPMEKLLKGIKAATADLSRAAFKRAAEAILTTDRFVKMASATCGVGGQTVHIAGMVKGAGMIAPSMATMLAYILTDAAVESRCLRFVLRDAAETTFNSVTVDGDMSTNDTVLMLANGFANNSPVKHGTRDEAIFLKAVGGVMKELALKLVKDGEGATKVVEIRVEGARTVQEAKRVAFSVGESQLVKTAFYGEDPNFGRIMCAVGSAGVTIRPEKIDVLFNQVAVVKKGMGLVARERQAARVLKEPSFTVRIRLGLGSHSVSIWTCDLTHEYVRINSAYRT